MDLDAAGAKGVEGTLRRDRQGLNAVEILGRPCRCTSPAETMVVTTPWRRPAPRHGIARRTHARPLFGSTWPGCVRPPLLRPGSPHPRMSSNTRALRGMAMVCWYLNRNGDLVLSLWAKEPRIRRADRPRCKARTRRGKPCGAPVVWDKHLDQPRNDRCRMHGGLSTGPKTAAGRDSIRASNRRRAYKTKQT